MNRRDFFQNGFFSMANGISPISINLAGRLTPSLPDSKITNNFKKISELISEKNIIHGDVYFTEKGKFRVIDSDYYPTNIHTVFQLSGLEGQAVLLPSEPLQDSSALFLDTRPQEWFAEGLHIRTIIDGVVFEVAPSSATTHHVTTAGGAKFYLAGDSTSANAVGAVDGPNPLGREDYAPALVTSMKDRRLHGVKLRDLVGRNYSPVNDAAATISGFLPELAGAGIAIHDPDNTHIMCEEPIRIVSDLKLLLGPNTTLVRGYADKSGDNSALLSRADWNTDTDRLYLRGGILTTASPSQTGKLMAIYGNDWNIEGTQFTEFYGGQAIVFGGDRNRITNCSAITRATSVGTGAFRMVGGRHFVGQGLYAETGDDLFQFVPIAGNTNARFDKDIHDSWFINCHGHAHAARVFVAVVAAPATTNDMKCVIRRCGWIGCTGGGGDRSFVIENQDGVRTDGMADVPRQIDEIYAIGCSMDGSHQNEDTSQDVLIQNTISGGIGTVTLRDTVIHSTDRKFNVSMIGDGAELILDNVTCTAETSNIYIQGQSKLTIRDGRYMLADGGGGNAAGHNVNLTPGCDATELRVEGTPKFEVADKKAAIRLSSATCKAYINGFQADKKAGATSTVGLSHSAGATAKVVTDIRGTVDKLEAGSGTVTYAVYE